MPDDMSGLFRESAMRKVNSPDRLDDYIKVANPSVWVVLIAAVVLFGALLYWSIVGSIPTNVDANGVISNGQVVCYLSPDKVTEVNAGDSASVLNQPGTVVDVSSIPYSSQEASKGIDSDYTIYELGLSDWNYVVTIQVDGMDEADGTLVPVVITAEEVAPISFLTN